MLSLDVCARASRFAFATNPSPEGDAYVGTQGAIERLERKRNNVEAGKEENRGCGGTCATDGIRITEELHTRDLNRVRKATRAAVKGCSPPFVVDFAFAAMPLYMS